MSILTYIREITTEFPLISFVIQKKSPLWTLHLPSAKQCQCLAKLPGWAESTNFEAIVSIPRLREKWIRGERKRPLKLPSVYNSSWSRNLQTPNIFICEISSISLRTWRPVRQIRRKYVAIPFPVPGRQTLVGSVLDLTSNHTFHCGVFLNERCVDFAKLSFRRKALNHRILNNSKQKNS